MGRGRGRGGGGGVAASLAALLWCGCVVMALAAAAAAQGPRLPSAYKTLSGDAPRVVAKGGFSGVFPDSSSDAYSFALIASAPDTTLWCDLQLTKDGVGVCLRDINMQNCTNVAQAYPTRKRTYVIDGVRKNGWFTPDFTKDELQEKVILTQAIWSRTDKFDFVRYAILSVTDLLYIAKQPSVWLNVQHDTFYKERGLNMRNYILSIQKRISADYISSPELGFLQNISGTVHRKTKLVFSFLDKSLLDHSINQTYGSLLSNLTLIKSIASGIMVPKTYIWPVTNDNYLKSSPLPIVEEAHNAGLEIYASDFANDRIIPYNYSYDPLAEYLNFISDGGFSVDGVLSEHPITASKAIGCFTNLNSSKADHGEPLVISHNGASGDYPDCTDLAYHSAINDGADVIDCPVQVTSDGVLICMSSINLLDTTNVQRTTFGSRSSVVSEIQPTPGIFTFNLTWDDINSSTLKRMEFPVDDPSFLENILGEDGGSVGLDDMDIGFTQNSQINEEVQVTRSTKAGVVKRKKNFHWRDDEVICSGWLNVSKDPVLGANQTRSSFWKKIHAFYEEHKEASSPVRTVSSVMHRWLTIQLQVNKFCSCYEAILRRNQSGLTIEDKINEAKKLYVEWDKEDKSFGLLHCWTILKGEDKWKSKMIEIAETEKEKERSKKKQKSPSQRDEGVSSDDAAPHDIQTNAPTDAIIEADSEQTPPKKRSDGIKKVKANLKRGGSEACMEALEKMMAKREASEKAKEARYMASLEVEKAALEKDIMLADMSSLNPTQRAWIEKKQKMILAKMEEN